MATFGPYTDAVIATAGIRSYWKLNENSGLVANAAVGAESGAYTGSPTLGAPSLLGSDPLDKAMSTAPASSYMGVSPHTPVCTAVNAVFSMEAWVAFTAATLNVFLFGEGSSSTTNPAFAVGVSAATAGKLRIFFRNSVGTSSITTESAAAFNDGKPHHLVATSDGTTVNLYADGDVVVSGIPPTGSVSLNRFGVGCLYRTTAASFMPGTYDEVALYNQALPLATIHNHLALGRSAGVLL